MKSNARTERPARRTQNRCGYIGSKRRSKADISDAELLVRAKAGEEEAWVLLVERYDAMVRHVARRVGLNATDAGDVSQTTWMRLVRNVGRIREPARLPGWLKTTSRNEAIALAMRDTRRQDREEALFAEPTRRGSDERCPLTQVLDAEQTSSLTAAVQTLPAGRRELVQLLANGASYSEVHEVTGLPLGSIGPTWGRSIRMLRQATQVAGLSEEPVAS